MVSLKREQFEHAGKTKFALHSEENVKRFPKSATYDQDLI